MTLTELLAPYFPDGPQNALAMDWLARWQKGGGKTLSDATVESRLSELRREKPDGVRFFYNDPAREALLAEVLALPHEIRAAARERAEAVLAQGGAQAPRLVMDLSGLTPNPGDADALFQQLKRDLLGDAPILPLVLVVDELQYDRLPRSFDDMKPRLSYVKVAGAVEGREKARELAGETAVVASPWRHTSDARWLAIRWWKGTLAYGPPDGVERIRTDGRLPSAPTPAHDAAELLDGAEPPRVKAPDDPLKLRGLVDALGDPARAAALGELAMRVAMARALGVVAASTEAERQEVEARRERERVEREVADAIEKLAIPVAGGSEVDVTRAERRAAYVQGEPVAYRVGDTVHVVGAASLEVPKHPRIVRHAVRAQPTALQRLLEATRGMTLDDWRADPLLLGAIGRLADGDARENLLLLHARASLVLSGALKPAAPQPVEGWRTALTPLFEADPPEAWLWPDVSAEPVTWVDGCVSVRPWVFPDGRLFLTQVKDCPPLYWVPPLTSRFLTRAEKLVAFRPKTGRYRTENNYSGGLRELPKALVPVDAAVATNPEVWQTCVEASPFLGGREGDAVRVWQQHQQKLQSGGALPDWVQSTLALPSGTWFQADRELATTWLAIRRALRQGDAVRLHTGRVLLDLGGGLLADLDVRAHGGADTPVRGALHLGVSSFSISSTDWNDRDYEVRATLAPLTTRVDTHLAHTPYGSTAFVTSLGYALPARVTVTGRGVAVDISFVASPLLAAGAPSNAPVLASAAGVTVATAADEEDQAAYDD